MTYKEWLKEVLNRMVSGYIADDMMQGARILKALSESGRVDPAKECLSGKTPSQFINGMMEIRIG
jgi:hypothetical protein